MHLINQVHNFNVCFFLSFQVSGTEPSDNSLTVSTY